MPPGVTKMWKEWTHWTGESFLHELASESINTGRAFFRDFLREFNFLTSLNWVNTLRSRIKSYAGL